MQITIGELTPEILPFCTHGEIGYNGGSPFLKVFLGSETMTRACMLIVQTAEYKYSVCDTDDELQERYMITRSKLRPLVKEKDFIRQWLGKKKEEDENETILLNLNKSEFKEYFFKVLMKYSIVKLTEKCYESPLRTLGTSSSKIFRGLETLCKIKGFESGTVKDFIKMIQTSETPISLVKHKDEDVKEIVRQFKRNGILLTVHDKIISEIKFERK